MPRTPMTITRRFSILAPLALGACAVMEPRLEPAQDKLNAFGRSADATLDTWKSALFTRQAKDAQGRWAALEKKAGGRLGVAVLGGGRVFAAHRGDERFALCSTFKLALAALTLREAQAGRLDLREIVTYSEADLLEHAPETRANLATGMSIQDLAKAAQVTSDNTAANLLLARFGGPDGFTQRLRAIGDDVTRLDRIEPEMNRVKAGEVQDTTTPIAYALTALRIATGDVLIPAHRDLLVGWMRETQTGAARLRGVLPADWNAGDKTGTGYGNGILNKTNDVAVAFPLKLGPVAIAAYYEAPLAAAEARPEDEAVLAEAGKIAVRALGA